MTVAELQMVLAKLLMSGTSPDAPVLLPGGSSAYPAEKVRSASTTTAYRKPEKSRATVFRFYGEGDQSPESVVFLQ